MPPQDNADIMEIATPPHKTLLNLPPELILRIADFLPTSSCASLSLCNKRFAAQLSSKTWNLLPSLDSEDRISFLTFLSRDLPRHHACHGCIRLHLSSSTALPADFTAPVPPNSCIPASARGGQRENGILRISNYFSAYHLRFPHVQLALKQHHYGPEHGIAPSDLPHTEIQIVRGIMFLFTVEARIVSNEMIVRSQEWVLSSEHPRKDFLSRRHTHNVCQHLLTYNAEYGLKDDFTSLLRCQFSHRPSDARCTCMGLQHCSFCPMEYQIDLVEFEKLGTAICATKWLNLGSGLTARDSKWYGHNLLQDSYVPHHLPLGSIRSNYESHEGLSFDELSAENKKMLSSSLRLVGSCVQLDTFRSNWNLVGDDIWYLNTSVGSETIALLAHRLLASASITFVHLTEILLGMVALVWSKLW